MKKSAQIMGPLHFAFFSTVLIGLAAALIEAASPARPTPAAPRRPVSFKDLALIGAVFALAQFSYVILITMEKIAHTVAFQPLGIIFQMGLAYVFLHEREHPVRRLIYGSGIVAGSVLLELGRLA